ncbi:hypothetical protein BLA24_25630 [Streptomyces cinnamoneus]|uniref:Uncharacterized protein n=1 Tax=Streptomyces cinnamoneus TaxID=53446 RepID=A0A2G1XDY8_STRCJ|nr:hypothetical protein [Streptomyces cinnamoneus]PHQ49425.1 hypothetical protein BLA24_25630 [Streptomyces cinnamoneus]PPT14925.1 hypothetical protein CYQ11_20440 [Streptomyces cinnamoneus]
MSVKDELTMMQRCLDDLDRAIGRIEQRLGRGGLDVRRVRTDAGHLRESVALLSPDGCGPGGVHVERLPREAMVQISDAPYDASLWTDAQDEGLGSPTGHAP